MIVVPGTGEVEEWCSELGQYGSCCPRIGPRGSGWTGALAFPRGRPESRRVEHGKRAGTAAPDSEGGTFRRVLLGALLAGGAARVALAFLRPLWADEVFTLGVGRRSLQALLEALRVDSGPPLHYLAAKLLLFPLPGPGPADVVVRLLSVAASLLHVPLFLRIGRRSGAPRAGLAAAALFLVFPLAVASGAEARGYALASFLALASYERLLALRGAPRAATAVAAGALGGAAFLAHYLALLPVGGALLAELARSRRRGGPLLAGIVAAGIAAAWLPVALEQPRASMAWAATMPIGQRAVAFTVNLGLGLPAGSGPALLLVPLALAALGLALSSRSAARVPAAGPLCASLVLLGPLVLFSDAALLPDRTAVLFLPFVALLLAEARAAVPLGAGLAAAAVLAASFPGWLRTTPAEHLAATLERPVRSGATVVAAGLWGPELDYRLARAGLPGRVALFPSDVARHPGWYDEAEVPASRYAEEAAAAVRSATRQTFFVFLPASRAGGALVPELVRAGGARVAAAGLFDVWLLDPVRPSRGTPSAPAAGASEGSSR